MRLAAAFQEKGKSAKKGVSQEKGVGLETARTKADEKENKE